MNGVQLADAAGVTYKQVTHWTRRGWLKPADPTPGSGIPCDYPPEEVAVAKRMANLIDWGFRPDMAAALARLGPARLAAELATCAAETTEAGR